MVCFKICEVIVCQLYFNRKKTIAVCWAGNLFYASLRKCCIRQTMQMPVGLIWHLPTYIIPPTIHHSFWNNGKWKIEGEFCDNHMRVHSVSRTDHQLHGQREQSIPSLTELGTQL